MEGPLMLMDSQNHYCENGYITKSSLHVQCNYHQNFNNIHHKDRKINLKVLSEARKTLSIQGKTEQKEQHWRHHNTQLETILQSHSNKSSMVLTQKHMKTSATD
jgi:hypothetical protein